jgi:hypothetical protein
MIIKNKYATFIGHKYHGKFYVDVQKWTEPDAPSETNVLAATALADGSTTTVTTDITNPDFPRALQIKGNAGGISGNVVITGTNIRGETITDTIVANGASAVEGVKAFKSVTSILLPARNAGGDTISVGVIDELGLQSIPWSTDVESEHSGNAVDTGGTVLTRDASNIEECLYAPTTESNGSTDKMISYLSEDTDSKISSYTE